jgi:6-pyruvoyltetrahydropterin/6-carboxytetrahydropterin synthase
MGEGGRYTSIMFRLTREVRFAINTSPDDQLQHKPANSYGGYPSLAGLGHFFTLEVTLAGDLDLASSYLINIKQIDMAVREIAIERIERIIRYNQFGGGANVVLMLFELLRDRWPGVSLDALKLSLSPFLSLSVHASEIPMVRLSQKFEFSASHRLHNPDLSDEQNVKTFGKCNNPHGHGHNYELQVTLAGKPNENGVLIDVPAFERIVATTVIDRLDHKNLNVQVAEFKGLIPSVENIAKVIFNLLKPQFAAQSAQLSSVTVWETPKTWCEYRE